MGFKGSGKGEEMRLVEEDSGGSKPALLGGLRDWVLTLLLFMTEATGNK